MRSLRDWNWKQWIIVAVQDQRWDRNFRQPIEIVGPQSLPGDPVPLPFEDGTAGAVLASKAHRTVNQFRRHQLRPVSNVAQQQPTLLIGSAAA
jgi:hypothetical protein